MKKINYLVMFFVIIFIYGCSEVQSFTNNGLQEFKNIRLNFDESITLSDAVDNYKFYDFVEWDVFSTKQNRTVGEFRGYVSQDSKLMTTGSKDVLEQINWVAEIFQFSKQPDGRYQFYAAGVVVNWKNGNEEILSYDEIARLFYEDLYFAIVFMGGDMDFSEQHITRIKEIYNDISI